MDKKEKARPESVSRTFRIEESILEELQQHAAEKRISINTLGNQIFRQYLEFYANADSAGFVSVHRSLITKLMTGHAEDELASIGAQVVQESIEDTLFLLGYSQTINSIISFIETWVRVSGFQSRSKTEGNTYTLFMQHDMGRNWSVMLGSGIMTMITKAGSKAELEVADKHLILKINLPH